MSDRRTVYRVCPFCEATCGLAVEVEGNNIVSVRGDKEDPFSRGYICPKAHGLKELHADPDRLRTPMRRTATGWEAITWDEAYADMATRLLAIRDKYGASAIGMYLGNPMVHDFALLYFPVLARALGSRSVFNPATADTLPKEISTALMFGGPFPSTTPIPDIDRTDYLIIIGANPAISHGSLMTMPDAPGRIKGVLGRGGKVVVVDPRRTETAKLASEHHFIRPATDAAFLLAMVHTLFEENLVSLGTVENLVNGVDEVRTVASEFTPEAVAEYCGIDAGTIRRLAREFAAATSAACYGRLGTCVQEFGTLASWGCDLLNTLTGNLDRAGGVMFTRAAASLAPMSKGKFLDHARHVSRVSGQPISSGMLPSSTMAEEILTPGDGQVRAMITLMTNPVRSTANSEQTERAFASLEYFVAMDLYINETTRHAHLILPTPSAAEQDYYELGLYQLAVRNFTKWSRAAVAPAPETPGSWQVMLKLIGIFMGMAERPFREVDDVVFAQLAGGLIKRSRQWDGLTFEEVAAQLAGSSGPERTIDLLLRIGPYGDGFGRNPDGLTLAKVRAAEHGIDLGPHTPRLREIINTPSGKVELAPPLMLNDLARLRTDMARRERGMRLIGRRNLRTTNSFMHNLPALMKGRDVCTLQMSPDDARRIGITDGGAARVTSRVGSVVAPVQITDDLMPGVVSLPHGWGHNVEASRINVAKQHPGANANALTDDRAYDAASGTAVLFGTPVSVEAVLESGK
ncbi:MAG TPA: molybdopterin-dependent oxidoreductase [Candidatus Binataceae bacterium]|nr:molybdopterin-dependent oxidoreductase [Candidatus Binataceae bacterium]